jgi:hypothetical protein
VDGTNAIESLKGLIEDPELYKRIKEQAAEDPDACVRPLVKEWLELNAPEALEQLDFGDMVDDPEAAQGGDQTAPEAEPAPVDPAAAAVPAEEPVPQEAIDSDNPRDYERPAVDRKKSGQPPLTMKDVEYKDDKPKRDFEKRKQRLNTEELAEFLHSFYDRDSGTFPKGPEGVCTMVGKKFGEQAESVARKMVERMAPQQQDPQIAELSRIRELAGTTARVSEDLQADDGQAYDDSADFFGQFEADHFDEEKESDDGMEIRGYIDGVNVMAWRFDDESKTSGYGNYDDSTLGQEESSELTRIRELSGISQGIRM